MNDSNVDFEIDTSESHRSDTRNGLEARVRRGPLQWNLKTMILLALLCACWFCYHRLRDDNERMRSAIQAMRAESKALVVLYNDRVALVSAPKTWSDQRKWNLALPSKETVGNGGAAYKLCLATSGLQFGRLPSEVTKFALPHGRHAIEIMKSDTQDGFEVRVLLDDQEVIKVNQVHAWGAERGESGSEGYKSQSFQPGSAVESVELYGMYLTDDKMPEVSKTSQHNGVLLWLEPLREAGQLGGGL